MATADPVSCTCTKNSCTRVKGRQGDGTRGYCPCRQNGTACTYLCACGSHKFPCLNTDYLEEDEDDLLYNELDDPEYECEKACNESPCENSGDEEFERGNTVNPRRQDLHNQGCDSNSNLVRVAVEETFEEGKAEKKGKGKCSETKQPRKKKQSSEVEGPSGNRKKKKSTEVQGPSDAKQKKKSTEVQGPSEAKKRKKSSDVLRTAEVEEATSKVMQLSPDGLQALVIDLAGLYPDLVLMAMGRNPSDPPSNTLTSGWCHCYHCREMPTLIERECCIPSSNQKCILIREAGPINQIVLSRTALEVAILNHNEYMIQDDDPTEHDTLRHMAYRKFILWKRGYLGPGVRVVIPSCVVWAIRDRYPSADGTYTGYKPH